MFSRTKLFATKSLTQLTAESEEQGEHTLKRSLNAMHLITLGIGAIIGAGIFVLTGQAAAKYAGPAISLSFVLAGFTCAFAGLCYAEFASIIPIAGSAYTYGYATLGELVAWIIGWDLILEYAFGAATVASGWSGYFTSLLEQLHIHLPPEITMTYGNGGVFNVVAFAAVLAVTGVLIIGIQESATLNSIVVVVKLAIVGVFLAIGIWYLLQHPGLAQSNWHPFIPPEDKAGNFGFGGIAAGAASVFFAYIGFDAVSTAAQEAKNPQRDVPIGILGSLVVCTILYIAVALVLTGLVSYKTLNVADPVAVGIDAAGVSWGSFLVKIGAVFGLGTVMLVMLLAQSRIFFSMSRDGLLPRWASVIHPKFRTPWISTASVGLVVAVLAGALPIDRLSQLVNMGTLLAFTIVCAGVWVLRRRDPQLHRPFRTPFVPAVPALGIVSAGYLMFKLPLLTWIVLVTWLAIGLSIYFGYSARHSKVQQQQS